MKIYTRLLLRCVFLLSFCLCVSGAGWTQPQQGSVTDKWKQNTITLNFKNQSLSAIAKELADKTGKSILIEGEPILPGFDLNKTASVETLLNEVADAFDYSWHVSKSGVILFNKRFHNRLEYPQIVIPELNESIVDMLAAMHSATASVPSSSSVPDQMISFVRSLTPQQLDFMKHGGKLRIGSLPEEQRATAEQIISTNMFSDILRDWKLLGEQLAGLKQAFLQTDSHVSTNPTSHKQQTDISLLLRYGNPADRMTGLLQRTFTEDDLNAVDADKSADSAKDGGAVYPSRGTTTLGQAVHALSLEMKTPLVTASSLTSRRIIAQFRGATVSEAMSALAELGEWTWRQTEDGTSLLARPRRLSTSNGEEARQALRAALPADLRRFLTRTPGLADKEIIVPYGSAIYASHENAMRVHFKLGEQTRNTAYKLFLSLRSQLANHKNMPCSQLTSLQYSQLVLILTMKACASSVVNFTSCLDMPTTYESNPSDAYIYFHGVQNSTAAVEILIGGDTSATQRGGAFGTSIMLDTLTAPVYKMQKAAANP